LTPARPRPTRDLRGEPMLNPGHPAPDFTLTTHEGKTVSLKEFRGRKVLLWFYPKADTPG